MIRVQPGRGGWENSLLCRIAFCAALGAALILGGCSSKKGTQPSGANAGAAGIGEKNLEGSETSLSKFQQGKLGAEAGGPLTDVHFEYNDYTIRPQDGEILRVNASWLTKHPQAQVQVEGHCDERGSEDYNIALGARRAQAAKDYLITLGVGASRISTISYGKELPLCTEHDEDCWAKNRRAHFVITGGA
jgi:peptidoglycan-associated lipoprotein